VQVELSEELPSQRVRAHFVPDGAASLELLEATSDDSPIAKYVGKRGPGLHHVALRVEDIAAALAHLKDRGIKLIDEQPRPGAEHALVAFVHPASAHGVLVELKQARAGRVERLPAPVQRVERFSIGDFDIHTLYDGIFRLDGGSMFGVVPKTLWSRQAPADERNRITMAMRPLLIRGSRTVLVDAGLGDKDDARFHDSYGVDRRVSLDEALAEAGVAPDDIDIVIATHLHFDHAGGFTFRDPSGAVGPRVTRARDNNRRGEGEDATHTHRRKPARDLAHN
jgi:methylmalonyl-CoA epimerase